MDMHARLVKCFVEAMAINPEIVTNDLTYRSISQWDSIGHMALVAALETEFDLMLDTNDVIAMSSVSKAKQILAKYGVQFDVA